MKRVELDRLRALLLRAAALRKGQPGRDAAAPAEPGKWNKPTGRSAESGHEVEVSVAENRLHLTLRGFFDLAQADAMLLDVQLAFARLKPGFDVISDVSRLGTLTNAAGPVVRRMATSLVEGGMRQMVRVVGSAPGGATSMARAVEGVYTARVASSKADAARILDGGVGADSTAVQPWPTSDSSPPDFANGQRHRTKRWPSGARSAGKSRR